MSESVRHAPAQSSSEPSTVEELRDGVDKTRDELADSVDAGSSTLNGKARASQRMHAAKASAGHVLARAGQVVGRAKQQAPGPVLKAVDATGEKLSPLLHGSTARVAPLLRQGIDKVKLHRKRLLGGGVALLVALLGVRRRTGRARTRDHGAV
jgi:hypothetical protein